MNIYPHIQLSLAAFLTAFTYLPAAPAVIVDVESGNRAIRVESWDTQQARWNPVAQAHLSGSPGTAKIALPDNLSDNSTLRVSSLDTPLVPEFIIAQHAFGLPEKPASGAENTSTTGRDFLYPGVVFDGANPEQEGTGDQVLEADLWKRVGDRLYFFNQYRGLQVIDISDSSAPELVGSYRLPAQGEEMYPLSDDRLLLLAGSYSDGTQVHLLDVSGDDPVLLHTTDKFDGYYEDSRLVGNKLHMVQRQYYTFDENSVADYYRSRWQLQTLDYSNGTEPVIAEPTEYTQSGYHTAITVADSEYLFIILPHGTYDSPEGIRSRIVVFKLDTPDGLPLPMGMIHTTGQIGDKTKIYRNGGTLVTVSQSRTVAAERQIRTHVETFNLAAPNLPRFDAVSLAPGETLFATRFSGTRAYIVTFLIKDPLFALDFSDPNNIQTLGQLDIPGYSTWMQAIGNQLISVGVEEGRVAISLFDVADPTNMFLADRLYIGEPGSYSWSEANYDDRAVTLDIARQRIMIPYQSYGEEKNTAALALIDYTDGELKWEGSIDFSGTPPRRGQIYGNQLIALSGKDLKMASLEQSPLQISASLPVSWNVSQIEVRNEYLIQFVPQSGNYWYFYQPWSLNQAEPLKMYVTSTDEPDHVLAETLIPGDFLLGTTRIGNDLYTLTASMADDDSYTITSTQWNSSSLPQLDAETIWVSEKATEGYPGNGSYAADLIDGHVVWYPSSQNQYYAYPWAYGGIEFAATDAAIGLPYYYYQNSSSSAWVHPAQTTSDNVITQHVLSQTQLYQTPFWKSPYLYLATWKQYPIYPDEKIQTKYVREWQVWDFSNPAATPVSHEFPLPGEPVGVYRYNAATDLLLSSKWEYNSGTSPQSWTQTLQLQVWDGIQAFTAFSQIMPDTEYNYNNPLFENGFFFSTSYNYSADNPATTTLDILQLDYQQGAFVEHQSIPFEGYIHQLAYRHDALWIRAQNALFASQLTGDTWHTSEQLPVSSYVSLNFDASRETAPGTYLIPAYDYGVETVNLPGIVSTASQMSLHSAEPDDTGWTVLPQSRWRMSTTDNVTSVGKIAQRKWLFQPAANQPLLTDSESVADYWRYRDHFGLYFEGPVAEWRYHADYGWLRDAGEYQGGRLLLHPISGWFWIRTDLLPNAYNLSTQSWIIW